MKKSKKFIVLPFILLFLAACAQTENVKLRLIIPSSTGLDLTAYEDILITKFIELNEVEDFDVNQELEEYFTFELKKNLKKTTGAVEVQPPEEDVFTDIEYWAELPEKEKPSVYFTGSLKYNQETRKALIKKDKKQFEDPFPQEPRLARRTFFSIEFNVYMIDAKTGKPIYERKFKESKAYSNPNQTTRFAFFDLMVDIKDKLIQDLMGSQRLKERYLLTR